MFQAQQRVECKHFGKAKNYIPKIQKIVKSKLKKKSSIELSDFIWKEWCF